MYVAEEYRKLCDTISSKDDQIRIPHCSQKINKGNTGKKQEA